MQMMAIDGKDGKLSSGLSLGHVMVRSHLGSRWNFTVFPFAPILRQGAADDAVCPRFGPPSYDPAQLQDHDFYRHRCFGRTDRPEQT